MTIHVLVADDDLDMHELIDDILHINFKDVVIDRAMDSNGIRAKVRAMRPPYDLVVLGDDGMKGFMEILSDECPALVKKTVMIGSEGSGGNQSEAQRKWNDVPRIMRPFSLDDFGAIVGKICAA